MKGVDTRSVARGIATVVLALVPAYCSVDGLVTGETIALDKRASSYTGHAGLLTAISYGLFAIALVIAAGTFVAADSKRRKALAKLAWNVTVVATVLFFSGRIMTIFQ